MSHLHSVPNSWASCSFSTLPPFAASWGYGYWHCLGGFSVARDGVSIALFWQNILHPGRSCWQETLCCAGRRVNPVQRRRKSPLDSCSSQGPRPSLPQPPGSKGGREAPSLFLPELKRQPGGQGLSGLVGLVVGEMYSCAQGCNSQGGGAAAPQKGISTLEVGLAPWRMPQISSPLGSTYGLACFPGAEACRRQWA